VYWVIKLKLAEKNIAYDFVLSDLEALYEWAKELEGKEPPVGSAISDILYLQTAAIHILILSQFEYLLKSLGRIKDQWEIANIIRDSSVLSQLEKDHLTYLFLTRHTLAHNGGHFDEKFFQEAKSKIKELKLEMPKDEKHLSAINPDFLRRYIKLIKKMILLDIAGNVLSQDEKNELLQDEKKINSFF